MLPAMGEAEPTPSMSEREQLAEDIHRLAVERPHRGGITENERRAAEYIEHRFKQHSPLTQIEDFYSIDAYPYLFAMYYGEFLFVGLISIFLPWIALGYGLAVFLLYMAEFTGYSAMSRFLPHYETQNVTARFGRPDARRLLVVTAHYDSPKDYAWTDEANAPHLRRRHLVLVLSMVLILLTCGAQGFQVVPDGIPRVDLYVRAAAVAVLLAAALTLYSGVRQASFTRGANCNASGVAALLALAQRLEHTPTSSTEVLLVATGAKEMWLSGMRHFVRGIPPDRHTSFFLNLIGLGAGTLRYVTGEGMLYVYDSGKTLRDVAQAEAHRFGARPLVWRSLPTDAMIPLARGYEAMTLTATKHNDLPAHWNRDTDTAARIDEDVLMRAVDYAEAMVRRLDEQHETK